jgi:hypothetical protein
MLPDQLAWPPRENHESMNGDQQKSWRIDVHHHVVPPQFTDDSMPIKIDVETQRSMDNCTFERHH